MRAAQCRDLDSLPDQPVSTTNAIQYWIKMFREQIKCSKAYLKLLSRHLPEEIEENWKKSSVRINNNVVYNQTEYPSNTSLELYHCSISKVKLSRYCHAGSKGERIYSSYSFLTWATEGGEWSASRPGRAFSLGKGHPVYLPIGQEVVWR
jgi:hypothetical protein